MESNSSTSRYDQLSDDAREMMLSAVWHCMNTGQCMGMDEGYDRNGNKHSWFVELEDFLISEGINI